MTERIDHASEARRLLEKVAVFEDQHLEVAMTSAKVHATLALVEQQRVGNMIALMAMAARGVAEQTHSAQDYMEMFNRLNPQVIKGLGLNEGEKDVS